MEAASGSKGVGVGVGVWDGRPLGRQQSPGRQQRAFICGSPGIWDSRSAGDSKPLFLVLLGQRGRRCLGQKLCEVVGVSEGVVIGWRQRQKQLGRWS